MRAALFIVLGASFAACAQESSPGRGNAIERKLEAVRCDLDLQEVALPEALRFLAEVSGVNLVLDPRVEAERTAQELEVSLQVRDLPVARSLDLVLSLLDLVRTTREGVILVTTPGALEEEVHLEIYPVQDIVLELEDFPGPTITLAEEGPGAVIVLDRPTDEERRVFDEEGLVDLVRQVVRPDSWSNPRVSISARNGQLLVLQSDLAHAELRRLLAGIRSQL